jgi:hypothetical protein
MCACGRQRSENLDHPAHRESSDRAVRKSETRKAATITLPLKCVISDCNGDCNETINRSLGTIYGGEGGIRTRLRT